MLVLCIFAGGFSEWYTPYKSTVAAIASVCPSIKRSCAKGFLNLSLLFCRVFDNMVYDVQMFEGRRHCLLPSYTCKSCCFATL